MVKSIILRLQSYWNTKAVVAELYVEAFRLLQLYQIFIYFFMIHQMHHTLKKYLNQEMQNNNRLAWQSLPVKSVRFGLIFLTSSKAWQDF